MRTSIRFCQCEAIILTIEHSMGHTLSVLSVIIDFWRVGSKVYIVS